MTKALYRLVYLSHNETAGERVVVDEQIREILKTSCHNNTVAGVTGALMFNTEYFAQVLEGPYQAVQATFERIQCDDRHSKATVLLFEPSETRAFANWAMAYVGQDQPSLAQFAAIGEESGFDFSALDGDEIFGLLKENLREVESA